MAKDSPDFIDNKEVDLDFPPEANTSDINSSSVETILDQTETHYILQMTDDSDHAMWDPIVGTLPIR